MLADLEWQMIAHEAEFSATLDELQKTFILVNPEAIQVFLRANRPVASLLKGALPNFVKAFGTGTPLALDLLDDEADARSLYAVARWRGTSEEARHALQNFDDSWLIPNLGRTSGRIVFTYELV